MTGAYRGDCVYDYFTYRRVLAGHDSNHRKAKRERSGRLDRKTVKPGGETVWACR
jgi:hypothetical protein